MHFATFTQKILQNKGADAPFLMSAAFVTQTLRIFPCVFALAFSIQILLCKLHKNISHNL